MSLENVLCLLILVVGGATLLYWKAHPARKQSQKERTLFIVCSVMVGLAFFGYLRFGKLHYYGSDGRHLYHYHEMLHYYLGAKYYPEMGNTGLYDCTLLALHELEEAHIKAPSPRSLRDMRDPSRWMTATQALEERGPWCHERFSPERWSAFLKDVRVFLSRYWQPSWWHELMFDLGFNPPPTWNLFGSTLANLVPLSALTLDLLPLLDLATLFFLVPIVIFLTFGPLSTFGFILVASLNPLSSFGWTGGSFFRQQEMVTLALGICALKTRRYAWAGGMMGLSSALRVFPIVFAVGAVLPMGAQCFSDSSKRKDLRVYCTALAATLLITFAASLLMYGFSAWQEFLVKMVGHNQTFWVMHIGFPKLLAFSPEHTDQSFFFESGLDRFYVWQEKIREVYNSRRPLNIIVSFSALAMATFASLSRSAHVSSLLFGSCVLFFFSMPANYYYLYLAILGAVFLAEEGTSPLFTWTGLIATLAFIYLAPAITADHIVHNAYMNLSLAIFFFGLYLHCAWQGEKFLVSFRRMLYNRGVSPLHGKSPTLTDAKRQ